MKINKKVVQIIQIPIIIAILFFAFREIYTILINIDKKLFYMYSDRLTIFNILIVILLGIISYLPLSFYDLVLKNKLGIKLSWKKVYKYSWIASSVASLVGFGGSSAILIKNYLYKDHVDDSSKLVKEVSKVVGLNLSGFSLVCLIYSGWNIFTIKKFDTIFYISTLIGSYLPIILIWLTYKLYINKNKESYLLSLEIIGISILEWATTILLVYGLMVILNIKVSITQFFPIYVMAIIVAMISMVPGGVGTFDLTLLVGLKEFNVPAEQVLLLILLYRLSYYIVPVVIGVGLFLSDLYMKINNEARELISRLNSKVAHFALTISILVTGISLILGNEIYFLRYFPNKENVFNIGVGEFSLYISIILGFILIVISTILYSKTKTVYYSMISVYGIITLITIFKEHTLFEYIFLGVSWILIIFSKDRFYRKDFIFTWKNVVKAISYVLIAFMYRLIAVYFRERKMGDYNDLEYTIIEIFNQNRILAAVFFATALAILLILLLVWLNNLNRFPKEALDKERVKNIIEEYGGSRLAHYVFTGDKYVYINKKSDVFFQYQISGDKIIILGNPVGNKNSFFDGIEEFLELADLYGYSLVFSGIDKDIIIDLHDLGYEFMKIGMDAYVELNKFSLSGNKNKSNRQAIGRIAKYGYTFSIIEPDFTEELFNELKEVSDEWLNGKAEKGFCVGFFDRGYLNMDKIAIVRDQEGKIKGFANIMPMYDGKTISIDLMRFKKIQLNGIMDYMFANIFEYAKESGYEYFNLGLAPLADVGRTKHAFFREKVAYQMFNFGDYFYSFKGLKRFKDKYATKWEERYLAYKKGSSVIITAIQLILLLSKERNK
ncbi:MAG: Phosphatidylglycerol lysyltransferase [uncultured Clostridium sp.]